MSVIGQAGGRIPRPDEWLNDSSDWHLQTSIMDDRVGHAGLLALWLKCSTAKRLTSSFFSLYLLCGRTQKCLVHKQLCTNAHTLWHIRSHSISFCTPFTCLISPPSLLHLLTLWFGLFGLNPVTMSERWKEGGRERQWESNIGVQKIMKNVGENKRKLEMKALQFVQKWNPFLWS